MLQVRVLSASDAADDVLAELETLAPAVQNVVRQGVTIDGHDVVLADVAPGAADTILARLTGLGVAPDAIALIRTESVTPVSSNQGVRWLGGVSDAPSWVEVMGQASSAARLLVRYVVIMAAAGAIASIGVLDNNPILIVGAMAISPDIVPMSAACVGLVGHRFALVGRAVATLAIGLASAAIASGATAQILVAADVLGTKSAAAALGTLATPDLSTVVIALAAGVAGMLTFESQRGLAVGVGISVTTIPAVAYLGVVAGEGHTKAALNAVAVLVTNVLGVVVAGTLTLLVQRWWRDRHEISEARETSAA